MSKSKPWSMNPEDVTFGFTQSSKPSRRKRRLSRELDKRGLEMKLTHVPTGLDVLREVPSGHFSRKAMRDQRDQLYRELYAELEAKVARHLRVPGR